MNVEESLHAEPAEKLKGRRAAPSSSNLLLVDEHTATEEVRAVFAHYRERFGRADLPGIMLCFATNPALLKGMLTIAEGFLFTESLVSRRHKEMIATYISRQNACPYCADSHGAMLQMQGASAEIIAAMQRCGVNEPLLTSAEAGLLRFAAKVNTNSAAITRADIETAIGSGWSEEQITETVHIAALFAAFNRIANGFGLPTPFPQGFQS